MSRLNSIGELETTELEIKPIIIGFIIDASNSMKNHWKNQQGQSIPKIKIILEELNRQLSKLRAFRVSKRERQIEVFCLGMGFKRIFRMAPTDLKFGREKNISDDEIEKTQVDVVCDLLALTELFSNAADYQLLIDRTTIKWNRYIEELISKRKIEDDIDQKLYDFIYVALEKAQINRLYFDPRYWAFKFLDTFKVYKYSYRIFNRWEKLNGVVTQIIEKAKLGAAQTSKRNLERVLTRSGVILEENKLDYAKYINETLYDFVYDQCIIISDLVSCGHSHENVLESFDERYVEALIRKIYEHLEKDMREKIIGVWASSQKDLMLEGLLGGVRLNQTELERLTKRCIERYSWLKLQPFVKDTYKTLFEKVGYEVTLKQLSTWVGLASSREVIREINDLRPILPETLVTADLSEKIMFGTTPIVQALNLASLRLMDQRYEKNEKYLVIISDGEFNADIPLQVTDLLKKSGITIITSLIRRNDVIKTLQKSAGKKWQPGAKLLFNMASTLDMDSSIYKLLQRSGYKMEDGVTLCCQLNLSDLLSDILEAVAVQ